MLKIELLQACLQALSGIIHSSASDVFSGNGIMPFPEIFGLTFYFSTHEVLYFVPILHFVPFGRYGPDADGYRRPSCG